MNIKTIILTGGNLDKKFALSFLQTYQYENLIVVDGGLSYLEEMKMEPTHIIGDFDTVPSEILSKYENMNHIKVFKLNPQKDETDTQEAMKLAVELKSNEIVLLGGFGSRLDHTLANIHLLSMPLRSGIDCYMIDPNNRIRLIDRPTKIEKRNQYGSYISLLPYTEKVDGLTLEGFKFPLKDYPYCLENSFGLGISNELDNEIGEISFRNGMLIMIEAQD